MKKILRESFIQILFYDPLDQIVRSEDDGFGLPKGISVPVRIPIFSEPAA